MTADAALGLVEWLRAQLDADEATARAATPGPWEWDDQGDGCGVFSTDPGDGDAVVFSHYGIDDGVSPSEADAAHIAPWDPARVLAEVAAKREILALHHEYRGCCPYCVDAGGPHRREAWPCPTLRALSAPYRSAPGWRPEWAAEVTA